MLPQLSLFQQYSIQSQDVMQTWLHWRHQDALLVQKHFVALFHPKPNECLHFDLESCNLMCTYTVVTHPCHIPPLAQARPMMICIYTSYTIVSCLPRACISPHERVGPGDETSYTITWSLIFGGGQASLVPTPVLSNPHDTFIWSCSSNSYTP